MVAYDTSFFFSCLTNCDLIKLPRVSVRLTFCSDSFPIHVTLNKIHCRTFTVYYLCLLFTHHQSPLPLPFPPFTDTDVFQTRTSFPRGLRRTHLPIVLLTLVVKSLKDRGFSGRRRDLCGIQNLVVVIVSRTQNFQSFLLS